MSQEESSDNSSDEELPDMATIKQEYMPTVPTSLFSPNGKSVTSPATSLPQESPKPSSSSQSPSSQSSSDAKQSTQPSSGSQPPSILSAPLVYQTPQGMVYATPSNGGVIFSLAQGDPASGQPPQFITIPLSAVMAANGQGELDLSKRK